MRIQDIFSKNLFRPINGVVKADQQDESIVWQELDEYVVTKELDLHFRKFFETYLNAVLNGHDPTVASRIGVWISGFFGSGKSHFLKILSYLLSNRDTRNPQTDEFKRAVAFLEGKIDDPMLLADIKRATQGDTDVILFNIDSRADSKEGRGAILSVFWRVFNEMQGFSGDAPHIAELERHLSGKGKYQEFQDRFQELTGEKWIEQRDAYQFMRDEVIEAVAKTLGQSLESAEKWFDTSEETLTQSIAAFAKRVKEYLDNQGDDHRIIFLVDEVGQFIGSDGHLMLNLQTITEELGRVCMGRAWVVVTSQEDIESILGDLKSAKANDFSKIQGRFTTRLSLSSSNTDEVIQVRLLEKTPDAEAELGRLFQEKGDILKNQLSFSHDSASLKTWRTKQEFTANYPFSPFHFQLVQKIFESIRKAGATGLHLSRGERSMLDAFQSAAGNISKNNVGALVPLFQFYPAIESFLDTAVKRTIEQAHNNDGLENPFDIHLLQTLFLIRYVDIIKPNVDNLVTLFIDEVDADRLAIKRRIEAGLQRLEKEVLINRNGDLYFFLTNEEREVSREIRNLEISEDDEIRLLSDTVFAEILGDQKQLRYKPFRRDYGYNRLMDHKPHGTRLDQEMGVEIITPLFDEYDEFTDTRCVMYTSEHPGRVVVKIADSKELLSEVRTCVQTDKYIRKKSDPSQSESFKRILRDRQDENRERKARVARLLEDLVTNGTFHALGQSLEISAATPKAAVEEGLTHVIQNLYNKFGYLDTLTDDPNREVKAVILADDLSRQEITDSLTTINPAAVREVREFIELQVARNHTVLLSDLVDRFAGKPYGWPEWEVVLLTARLFTAGEINLQSDGSPLLPKDAVEPLLTVRKRKTVRITRRKAVTRDQVEKARRLCQEVFGKIGPENATELEEAVRQELGAWQKTLGEYRQLAATGRYPGKRELDDGLGVVGEVLKVRDSFEFITTFLNHKDDLLNTSDDLHTLIDFHTNQRPIWEKLRHSLEEFEGNKAALQKNPEAAAAMTRLLRIAEAPAPYSMLKDVDPLVSTVQSVNTTLLQTRREKALKDIEEQLVAIHAELENVEADNDLRNEVLHPLQQIKALIGAETNIPNIVYRMEEFQAHQDEAYTRMDEYKQERIEEKNGKKQKPKPTRQVKSVRVSSIGTKPYLDSEEDIESFVEKLRSKLLEELKDDVRIRIE